jgi:hypothetical protein
VQRNEHRANPRGLADLLLPHALIDDGILLQQDGSLLTGWTYRGPDMMSAAPAENLFVDGRKSKAGGGDVEKDTLYEEIGRLKVELDWLKKKVGLLD